MILIGSGALKYYFDIKRKIHDMDYLMSEEELIKFDNTYKKFHIKTTEYSLIYDIDGNIVEIRNPKFLDDTDKQLFDSKNEFSSVFSPFGETLIPSIQFLYDIKKSTALCIDEPKHRHDLKLIESHYKIKQDTPFFKARLLETCERCKKSNKTKYDFFHKYHIPEYIIHDRLHEMFADLLDINIPTYVKTIIGAVETSQELYNKLTHAEKVSLMVEESLVLNMERWFIPRMIEDGINYKLIDMFYNNNEAMPTYLIMKHVNSTGLKGEAAYVVQFGRDNFFEIEQGWIEAKEKIKAKGGLPDWFFKELFDLRAKYRKKEIVAIS